MNLNNDKKSALFFLLPASLGFSIFLLFPVLYSLFLSFCKWDLVSGFGGIRFIGLGNYIELFNDEWFINSLKNNIIYSIGTVPTTIIIAFIFALILDDKVYLKGFLRLIYFIPHVTNIVAVSVVWMALYHPNYGPINQFLFSIGIENPPRWLASPNTALLAIIIMNIWLGTGYCMVIYLAALNEIPSHYYDAAEIDGANGLKKLIYITIPMVSPTTFFLFVTRLIFSFMVFGPVNIMTEGGPGQSTTVLVFYLFKTAFSYRRMGYASAIAWVLFILIFIITIIQWKRQKEWVSYR